MASMEPLRWLLANAELDRVLEQTPDARATFLASLRARDAALAADVESLLAEHHALDASGLLTGSSPGVATQPGDVAHAGGAAPPGSTLAPGTALGPYRIVRPLGRGGMGAVYEADEVDSGRRVALKVLKERLHDPRERERFNREGRLAASLNHPHCVFVFAAAEVDGRLAIAMELMQGTLADRVKAHGPLPPGEAVDAALQLISGLEAAAAIGILHRDVKPSNCFVSADGVIKIGDFGISRSLRPTEETAFSTRTRFAATPAYASPEQLRGAALDTRADIYSLGATLYELLTGRPPFERDDLMALLMAVANDAPQPPHALASAVPKGLSQVVLRCLAKQPEQRFSDYDALAAALEPYSSMASSPATLGRRLFAGIADQCAAGLVAAVLSLWWMGIFIPTERLALSRQQGLWFLVMLAYFGITEAVWAASPGKALVDLTVVDSHGRPPRPSQAVARATLFAAAWIAGVVAWLVLRADSSHVVSSSVPWIVFLMSVVPWTVPAAFFSTARRRSGYAAIHDLVTGTRVVERRRLARSVGARVPGAMAPTPPQKVERLGSFEVGEGTITGMPAGWRPGYDVRLCRPVWIRQVPPGTPFPDPERLAVNRPTRLRWLAGRREAQEAWDAFEAVRGVPLEHACARPRGWVEARWWLLDLARECIAQGPGDHPPLRPDRVWILDTGGAKLVDDPAVERAVDGVRRSCLALLLDVVHIARRSAVQPWPLAARQFADRLASAPLQDTAAIVGQLEALVRQRAVLTRRLRAVHLLALVAGPLLFATTALLSTVSFAAWQGRIPREVNAVDYCLSELQRASLGRSNKSAEDLEAIEVALASRYRHVLLDSRMSTQEYLFLGLHYRESIERVLRRRPTAEESRRASENAFVQAIARYGTTSEFGMPPLRGTAILVIAILVTVLGAVALLALIMALVLRGGLMRVLGLDIVTTDGRAASRPRVGARAAIAWAPVIVAAPLVVAERFLGGGIAAPDPGIAIISGLAMLILFAGAGFAILNPSRGIQDRLAGTWIVPR